MRSGNYVALWAAASSFFATVLAIGAINVFNPEDQIRFLGAIVVALLTAGGVYAKQRLDDARTGRAHAGTIVVTESEDKDVFTLELDADTEDLKTKKEVTFKVRKA